MCQISYKFGENDKIAGYRVNHFDNLNMMLKRLCQRDSADNVFYFT